MRSSARRRTFVRVAASTFLFVSLTTVWGTDTAGRSQFAQRNASSAADYNADEPVICQGCTPPLTNRGGKVMGDGLTITPIYWSPSGFQYENGYTDVVNQFIGDVAAASGQPDNVFAVSTEYSSIKYDFKAGDPLTDTNPYPDGGCSPHGDGVTACVTSQQIITELESVLTSKNLPGGLDHIYPVFLPQKVQILDTDGTYSAPGSWCGVHNAVNWNDSQLVLSEDPYPLPGGGCDGAQAPNGNAAADAAVGVLSHEVMEAVTDPLNDPIGSRTWNDSTGNEIGDECNQIYGKPLGSTDPNNPGATAYNQVINGHKYYVQEEYSNASFTSKGFGKGCVQGEGDAPAESKNATASPLGGRGRLDAAGASRGRATSPAAATDSSAPSDTTAPGGTTDPSASETDNNQNGQFDTGGDGYSLFMYASPNQLPADKKSTTEISANATDANGDPVKNDHVHFVVDDLSKGGGNCGRVSAADVRSDASGDAKVTYTAGAGDAVCDVVAVETEGGQSATSTLYQGQAQSVAPTVTTKFPKSLTPGKQSSFTITYTNPTDKAKPNTSLDLEIYGGEDNSPTVNGKQLRLSYSTHGEAGPFKPVSMDGTTAPGDYIAVTVGPDAGETLPAHSTKTVTFHVTPLAGIPTSATLLDVEPYLDQVDPASGSGDTLADTDAVTLAVGTGSPSSSSSTGLIVGVGAGVAVVAIALVGFVIYRRRRQRTA